MGQAQNTPYIISSVRDKLLSDSWLDLTATADEIVDPPGSLVPPKARKRAFATERSKSAISEEPSDKADVAEVVPPGATPAS